MRDRTMTDCDSCEFELREGFHCRCGKLAVRHDPDSHQVLCADCQPLPPPPLEELERAARQLEAIFNGSYQAGNNDGKEKNGGGA